MERLEGWELVELTETRIVQRKKYGETGLIEIIGNPHPDPEKHQKIIDEIGQILYDVHVRNLKVEN